MQQQQAAPLSGGALRRPLGDRALLSSQEQHDRRSLHAAPSSIPSAVGGRIAAGRARQLAVSADGRTAFHPVGGGEAGGEDEVRVFDVISGQQINAFRGGHEWAAVGCCILNDGTTELFTGGEDGRVVIWGVPSAD